jgi:membrane protease YdiL (CAAX protease family)
VFVAWLMAFLAIMAFSILAAGALAAAYPDAAPATVLRELPGLLAGATAASMGLILTVLAVNRPFLPARLRLVPGRETGRDIALMILGMLALGQALDSLTALAGFGRHGALWDARRTLAGASGEQLFAAVLVLGPLAGTAEELFFRGYMQTRLRARWSPGWAVGATSACFAIMHLEWLHALLAFILGLYLGFIVEMAGSALPAIASHAVNNALFTLVTALGGAVLGFWPNVVLLAASGAVFWGCVVWLRRTFKTPA